VVLTHSLFVTFFHLFVLHLQLDIIVPLLLNASLPLVLLLLLLICVSWAITGQPWNSVFIHSV